MQRQRRETLVFFADILGYFVRPFIDVKMDLAEQLECLATYAFSTAYLWNMHGTACITGALYADSQAVVKNIIFTTARMQLIDRLLQKQFDKSDISVAQMFLTPNCDLLRPKGQYVGVQITLDDARSEEDSPALVLATARTTDPASNVQTQDPDVQPEEPNDQDDNSSHASIEETCAAVCALRTRLASVQRLKSALVHSLLSSNRAKKATMRTLRVQDVAMVDLHKSRYADLDARNLDDEDQMKQNDLVGTLVKCGDNICLVRKV